MKILVIYATFSSGTLITSKMIVDELQKKNHEVTLVEAAEADPSTLKNYDLIMMGSPSWWVKNQDGQPHDHFFELMDKMKDMKVEKKFAIFGLGDSSYARLCHAVDVLEEFVKNTLHGNIILEPLRVDSFYFDQKNNEKLILEWVEKVNAAIS